VCNSKPDCVKLSAAPRLAAVYSFSIPGLVVALLSWSVAPY
jgi:hypothetical protein